MMNTVDIESGGLVEALPETLETFQIRWGVITRIYSIIAFQLLVTIIVGSLVVYYPPFRAFFTTSDTGFAFNITFVTIAALIVLCLLCYCRERDPLNYVLCATFNVVIGFAVGIVCLFAPGKVIILSMILTTLVVISLILCTFSAAKRGHDFSFLVPFLFGALFVMIIFSVILLFDPVGIVSVLMFGSVASIISCVYIVYLTDNLIKRFIFSDE